MAINHFRKDFLSRFDSDILFIRPTPLRRFSDAGFTLIELLVAIAILAVVLGVAVLAIPNHDERYWRDNLDQLVSSLNLAQEESVLSGTPMMAQIDSAGWRFLVPGSNTIVTPSTSLSLSGSSSPANSSVGGAVGSAVSNPSGLMPDVYKPQAWYKPVEMAPVQLTLGGEQVTQALQIPITQVSGGVGSSTNRQAILLRNRNGRFSWVKS